MIKRARILAGCGCLLAAFIAFFLPLAHAENNPVPEQAQAARAPHRGALYRIRHQGHTTYLFGTIHVGIPTFFPLDAEVTQAFSSAARLVVEFDVRNSGPLQAALQKHGLYGAGDTLDRHLSRDSLSRLQQTLQRFHMSFEQIRHMKPWLAMNVLMMLDLERNGYLSQNGIDFFLLTNAGTKTVQELETAEYQMSLYDSMGAAEQEQYLRENLAELDDGSMLERTRALIDAWGSANGEALEKLLRESLEEKTVSSEFTRQVLLDKRNPEMADRIETLLKSGEPTFVAVGLLHLIGENGIPILLKQRGYEVEKLY